MEHVRDQSAGGPLQSSDDPPAWAKELLLQQKKDGCFHRLVLSQWFTSNGIKTLRSMFIKTIKESLRMFTFNWF